MTVDSGLNGLLLLIGRLFFGAVVAYMGYGHFAGLEQMTGYADAKGLPAPKAAVVVSGAVLVLGGLGLILGVLPVLSAAGLVVFLLVSAVTMHDYWAAPDDQRQAEQTQFLKNVSLAGGALAFLVLGGQAWAYAVNYTLF